jgi:hypothetical protein
MRLVVIRQDTDLKSLLKEIASAPARTEAASLERIRRLNPHVDLRHLSGGTVLLLPDIPELKPEHSQSIGADVFDGLASEVSRGFEVGAQRLRAGAETFNSDRAAVSAALRIAAVKRVLDSDESLQMQLKQATDQSGADQKEWQQAIKKVETMGEQVRDELAALARLLK